MSRRTVPQSFLLRIWILLYPLFFTILGPSRFLCVNCRLQKSHKFSKQNHMTFSSPVSIRTTIPPSPQNLNIFPSCTTDIASAYQLWLLPTTHRLPTPGTMCLPLQVREGDSCDTKRLELQMANWMQVQNVGMTKTASRRRIRGGESVTFLTPFNLINFACR